MTDLKTPLGQWAEQSDPNFDDDINIGYFSLFDTVPNQNWRFSVLLRNDYN